VGGDAGGDAGGDVGGDAGGVASPALRIGVTTAFLLCSAGRGPGVTLTLP
jgi:hypothetical protein